MKKILSLIRITFNNNMNIFKVNKKNQGKMTKIVLPIILTLYLMFIVGFYTKVLLDELMPLHLEYMVLTIFSLAVTILSLMEGVYKSGSLLFNCKDDDLLLSLPIKKRTVMLIRIFRFYIFELLYNSIFILPAMIIYSIIINPSITFYITSFIALLLLPIIPIILSCIIGFIITYLSSHFKGKNIIQTIFTTLLLLVILYLSFNSNNYVNDIASKVSNINELIIKIYYPIGTYISLINNFNIIVLFKFILVHIVAIIITIIVLGKIYFKINSNSKRVLSHSKSKNYLIKTRKKSSSFIRKELNRFVSTPVFITNAGFGLVLYLIICILISIRFDSVANSIISTGEISIEIIQSYLPIIMFGIICFGSFMTSITSSMISLEGKTINLLKSLPLKPIDIALYKVLTSLVIMLPCIIIGDIIVFIRFNFNIISIILLLIASVLLPFITELIGIIFNLKYPKMDAINDTEIVKQSMSAFISTLMGMILLGITIFVLLVLLSLNIPNNIILLLMNCFYGIICLILYLILVNTCDKSFSNIN